MRPTISRGTVPAGLPTLADVDRLLALSRGPVRVERGGVPVMPARHQSGRTVPDGTPDLSRIQLAFAKGCTVRIEGLQRRWPAVARLCGAGDEAELLVIPRESPPFELAGSLLLATSGQARVGDLDLQAGDTIFLPDAVTVTPGASSCVVVRVAPRPSASASGEARRGPRPGEDLPTVRDLDFLIALSRPSVRIDGAPAPAHAFHPERWEEGEPDLLRIVAAGGEVTVRDAHRHWPGLARAGGRAEIRRMPASRGRFDGPVRVMPLEAQEWNGARVQRGESIRVVGDWTAGPGTAALVFGLEVRPETPTEHSPRDSGSWRGEGSCEILGMYSHGSSTTPGPGRPGEATEGFSAGPLGQRQQPLAHEGAGEDLPGAL